jgi:hypothetical protein
LKISGVQEALKILKASIEDSSTDGKCVPKPEPRKSEKVKVKATRVRKTS